MAIKENKYKGDVKAAGVQPKKRKKFFTFIDTS